MNDKQAEQMMDEMADYQQGIADRLAAGKRLASWDEVPMDAYETRKERAEHHGEMVRQRVLNNALNILKKFYCEGDQK